MDTRQLSRDHSLLHRSGSDHAPVLSRFNSKPLMFPLDTKVIVDLTYDNKLGSHSSDTIKSIIDNNRSDNVRKVYFSFKLPIVGVKDEWKDKVQIRWTDKAVHHFVGSTLFNITINKNGTNKNVKAFYTDPIWSDLHYSYCVEKQDDYDDETGQTEDLMSWSSCLPETEVHYIIPWIWCKYMSQSFPIHNNEGSTSIESSFTCSIISQIARFLRIRIRKDGRWVYASPTDDVMRYLTKDDARSFRMGLNSTGPRSVVDHHSSAVPTVSTEFRDAVDHDSASDSDVSRTTQSHPVYEPEQETDDRRVRRRTARSRNGRSMRSSRSVRSGRNARTARTTKSFMNFLEFDNGRNQPKIWMSGTKQDQVFLEQHIVTNPLTKYFTYDVMCLVKEDMSPGSRRTFVLKGPDLHHALYFVARNKKSVTYNSLSNYTTNATNPDLGINPIKLVTIKVGDQVVFKGDATMLKMVAKESFPSQPRDIGYNAYSFSFNAFSPHNDTSYRSEGSTLITVEIALEPLDDKEEDTNFTVFIYSNAKRQVIHDRSANDIRVLRESFVE